MSEETGAIVSEEVVQTTIQEPNYEELASRQGWVPQEKWHGNPDTWKPAKDFYEDGEKFAPYIRANNRKLERQVEELSAHMREVTSWANQSQAALRKQMEQERAQAQHLITQLQTQKAEAIQNGDGIQVVHLENQIDVLKAKELEAATQAAPQHNPAVDARTAAAFQAWHVTNSWYGSDRRASAVADVAAEEYRSLNPGASPNDVFAHAEVEVKKVFPQYSDTPRQGIPAPEGSSARGTPRQGSKPKHSYADLPTEDKRICDMVVADAKHRKFEYSRDTFVKEYFGD